MTREVLGFGPFLASLERRLDELPAEQLRRLLLEHGARLPVGERVGFLHLFDAPASATGHDDPDLLDDVESFVASIASGAYTEGYGYDPDYREYRTFGDESWTIEMDDLFDRAGAAFLAGDVTLARGAYRVLLEALGRDDAESGFPGAGTPEELISSDIGEAKARYLRSVWESEPLATRAAALVEAADSGGYLAGDPSLAALDATRREPLPDLDRVLPDLIAALREINPNGLRFGAQARKLLAEATERHSGVDGLADLARTPGPRRAEAYRDWVDALAGVGRADDAEQAAHEALRTLDAHGSVQAGLADRLAALAIARDDGAALLDARRDAWRADPTLRRLLRLVAVATALDRRDEVLALEAGRAAAGPLAQRSGLAASLLLLAGRVDEASDLMVAADRVFWEHRGHPGAVVVPFLLIGGSGASGDQRWPRLLLCGLLNQLNSVDWPRGHDDDLDTFRAALPAGSLHGSPGDELRLSTLLIEVASQPVGCERRRWLDDGRAHVDSRVDAVVGGKHRSSYRPVAQLAAACAEAIVLATGATAGHAYLDGLHGRYPRHVSFRQELRSAAAESPLL